MAKGAISASTTAAELVAADGHRGEVILQHLSGNPVFLEFGDAVPVANQGLVLSSDFPIIRIADHRARLAINGICAASTATGTYCTDNMA